MRILIIDDHAMVREGLKRIPPGRIQKAGDAIEALAQVWKKPWELVLLDVAM
jgi:YesN/AraC family two-component response regulator